MEEKTTITKQIIYNQLTENNNKISHEIIIISNSFN